MGTSFSRSSNEERANNQPDPPALSILEQSRKRTIDQVYDSPRKARPEPVKKKKLRRTSEYIYDALFVNGENSDITIRSLGKKWKLHKVYLRQAGYFKSLYENRWKETSMEEIDLQIPDENINVEALDITFGSLYSEDVLISPSKVVSILAAASLIQLEGLMQQCAEVMKETICIDNIYEYLKSSSTYGQDDVCKQCMHWLETNLMLKHDLRLLLGMEPALLADIVRSHNLVVIQIEMDIYTLLKKWMYLRLNPSYVGEYKEVLDAAEKYFHKEAKLTDSFFLESDKGKRFAPVFEALRLQHIIRDFISCREIERDRIIPWSWLFHQYRQQWHTMLRIEQNIETGPTTFSPQLFETKGLRCGRLLLRDADHCWRWNGYNFGLDLLVSYSCHGPRTISFKRNVRSQRCSSSVSLSNTRNIIYQVVVTSIDENGRTILRKSTENTSLSLQKEQEQVVLTFDGESTCDQSGRLKLWKSFFPLIVTATFQLVDDLEAPDLSRRGYGIKTLSAFSDETKTLGGTTSGSQEK